MYNIILYLNHLELQFHNLEYLVTRIVLKIGGYKNLFSKFYQNYYLVKKV